MFIKLNNIKNTIFHNKKNIFILLFITIIGFFLRLYNNFEQGYWPDEILTLIISNPLLPHEQTLKNWKELDGSPVLYFYFLKIFFLIFGFTAENGRLFSVIFSTLLIFLSYFFFRIRYNNYFSIIGALLISLNIFLIWQAKETRIPSTVIFFSTLNILYFYYVLNKITILKILFLCFFNIFLVSYYPFTITIVFSQLLFFLLIKKNKEKIKYIFFYFGSLIFYIFINYSYLIKWTGQGKGMIGPISYKFFFNFFFSSFFGSYFLGGTFLLIFFYTLYNIYKKRISINDIIIFHLIIIFVTYAFLIIYTLFKSEIAIPRYFIFLIPSVLFVILDLFRNSFSNKFFAKLIIFIVCINTIILLPKSSIPKPPMNVLINNLLKDDSNIVYFSDPGFDIFIKNYKKINNNYKIISLTDIDDHKKIWFFCFNNLRSVVGDLILPDEEKCNIKLANFRSVKTIYITDFKILLLERVN